MKYVGCCENAHRHIMFDYGDAVTAEKLATFDDHNEYCSYHPSYIGKQKPLMERLDQLKKEFEELRDK